MACHADRSCLRISGEKHSTREHAGGSYSPMERGDGGFQRTLPEKHFSADALAGDSLR